MKMCEGTTGLNAICEYKAGRLKSKLNKYEPTFKGDI
jgi:hypothetical protein